MRADVATIRTLALIGVVLAGPVTGQAQPVAADTVWVSGARDAAGRDLPAPAGRTGRVVRTVTEAVARLPRHGVIVVGAGVYAEPTIIVRAPLTLQGQSGAVLDGGGMNEILAIGADSVTVRGLTFRNTGTSQATDRAALRVVEAGGCLIEENRFENTLFAIYLQRAASCLVRRNVMYGMEGSQTVTGNGVHSWSSHNLVVEDNEIVGHRDGIYFEFTVASVARHNVSRASRRYGLHFMFSDSCRYEGNTFQDNESGVAVMYAKAITMTGNRFVRNRGSAAYGLLLKEISDSEVRGNRFEENSVALHMEGANRNQVIDNDFLRNGWAVRVLAGAQDNLLRGNMFAGNVFDVGTNSRMNYSTFEGNWWDRYRGYDLDRNGRGDVAHAPVRLFALLVEQSPPALILVRSLLVDVLDIAERVVPVLTPATLRDQAPLMRPPRSLR